MDLALLFCAALALSALLYSESVAEQLKAQDQMLWVQRMNSIRDRAMEMVNTDLIYA